MLPKMPSYILAVLCWPTCHLPAPFTHPPHVLSCSPPPSCLPPPGTINPFCDSTGQWLPLLCTLNCTGVSEEVGDPAHQPAPHAVLCLRYAVRAVRGASPLSARRSTCQPAALALGMAPASAYLACTGQHSCRVPLPPCTTNHKTSIAPCRQLASLLPPQIRHAFGLSHEEITALAAGERSGCSGTTLLPYFAGERTPNWPNATGAVLGGWTGVQGRKRAPTVLAYSEAWRPGAAGAVPGEWLGGAARGMHGDSVRAGAGWEAGRLWMGGQGMACMALGCTPTFSRTWSPPLPCPPCRRPASRPAVPRRPGGCHLQPAGWHEAPAAVWAGGHVSGFLS